MFGGRLESYRPVGSSFSLQVLGGLAVYGPALNNAGVPRRLLAVALAALFLSSSPASAAGPAPLARKLSKALSVPHVAKSRTGAVAIDLATGKAVYAHNLGLPLIPASNEKLAVTYACLLALGPSFRFSTDALGEGELVGSVWRGDIFLKGYGDPMLSTLDLLKLASQLYAQGIRRVSGQVVGDESFFDAKRIAPGWKPWYFINESAPLSALTVDRARYQGRITREPALAAALSFRAALVRAGISVAGRAMTGTADETAVPLASTESVPLEQILRFMNHDSDNFTAEILLKQLGAGFALQGTTPAGAGVVHRLLAQQRIPIAGVRIVDGSGLSRLDRLTAASVVGMLQSSWLDQDLREILIGALPVAGRSGTLGRRMRGTVAAGRVRAKTGTLSVASALSGYVKRKYAFSIIQNGSPVSHFWARRAQDRFAAVLAAH
jgi:D-alanyl-D-alanine carboxypeptidase/D-alanyl-D-alanine-endopeptidase (penicillin-binding protein 4)